MTPNAEQRDAIFRAFGRAFFKQDMDAMYAVVTPDFTWTANVNTSFNRGRIESLGGAPNIPGVYSGWASTALVSRLMDAITGCGVFAGASTANQVAAE